MSFSADRYELVKNAVSKDICEFCALVFDIAYECKNLSTQNTEQSFKSNNLLVTNCFSSYGSNWSEALLLLVQPVMEKITEKRLYPSYSYSRIYYPGATLRIHKDRESCEYSATLTLKYEGNIWPIWLKNKQNNFVSFNIDQGDMLVYAGAELSHWRRKYVEGSKQTQVFLHYVSADGPFKQYKYDKRMFLGFEQNK